jgi:hypothetical protein
LNFRSSTPSGLALLHRSIAILVPDPGFEGEGLFKLRLSGSLSPAPSIATAALGGGHGRFGLQLLGCDTRQQATGTLADDGARRIKESSLASAHPPPRVGALYPKATFPVRRCARVRRRLAGRRS